MSTKTVLKRLAPTYFSGGLCPKCAPRRCLLWVLSSSLELAGVRGVNIRTGGQKPYQHRSGTSSVAGAGRFRRINAGTSGQIIRIIQKLKLQAARFSSPEKLQTPAHAP